MDDTKLKDYNDLCAKFETMPSIMELPSSDGESLRLTATLSIAISLKRIADVICRPPPIVAGLDSMTPEMREEWEKTQVEAANIIFNKS